MPEVVITSKLEGLDMPEAVEDNRETAIAVKDVSMVFNMASEQLNSLKEYAVALARGKLFFEGFTALDHISFEVKRGDVFGIVGTNGSGKSTLLKIVAGVLEPSEGSCEINGNIAPLIELGAGFDPELSARENIYLNGALLGYSREFINENFDNIVAFAEVEKFLDMPLKNYSSGMIARIAFSIATVIVPDILIVDEVLSVGDFMFQRKCEDRIASLIKDHGTTVLIVSHSNDQIQKMCNKVIWIEKGHTRLFGDASMVCGAYNVLGGRVGTKESEDKIFSEYADMVRFSKDFNDDCLSVVAADDYASTTCRGTNLAWHDQTSPYVIVPAGHTHANFIITTGLAGALDAPMLPMNEEGISEIVLQTIRTLESDKLVLASNAKKFDRAKMEIRDSSFEGQVDCLGSEDFEEYSLQVLEYARTKGIVLGDTAAIIDFSQNAASFALSPYLYAHACPVIMTNKGSLIAVDRVREALKLQGVKRIIVMGCMCDESGVAQLEGEGFEIIRLHGESLHEECAAASELVATDFEGSKGIAIGTSDICHWFDLLSCPAVCGRLKWPLILEDITDLDSVAYALTWMERVVPEKIVAFGQTALSETDRKLLAWVTSRARQQ